VTPPVVRPLAAALGVGTVLFGAAPVVAPGWFGRLFGIAAADNATVATAIRSVGVRDIVVGVGILTALRHSDMRALGDWLLARAVCDTGDTVAVGVALAAGARGRGFVLLGTLAAGAALFGGALAFTTRRNLRGVIR
jgi:uncharacterized protein YjeT (DUF2065 family)